MSDLRQMEFDQVLLQLASRVPTLALAGMGKESLRGSNPLSGRRPFDSVHHYGHRGLLLKMFLTKSSKSISIGFFIELSINI